MMLPTIDAREQLTPVHIPRPKPLRGTEDAERVVGEIVDDVRLRGDEALLAYTSRFDDVDLKRETMVVDAAEIERSRSLVRPEFLAALEVMAERLRTTCERQKPQTWIDRRDDEFVGELIRPLRRVGCYVPGGRAPLASSVVMTAVPAQVAGVGGIAVATPPNDRGEVPEAVLAACSVAGVSEVYKMGGAQAVAALAYGTETVRPVDKIVGPGNIFVTLAKRRVSGWVGIDSEAGPSEICVVADGSADPDHIALDIVAQAEHGPLGSHVLITWEAELAEAVVDRIGSKVMLHERPEDIENHLIEGGAVVLVRDRRHAFETVNAFAPEHLELMFAGAEDHLDEIESAGSVFVGPYSPVAVGDYVGGTNHVLPTGGTARFASALGVADFVKRIYVSGYSEAALRRLAEHVDALSEAEGLFAHGRSVWDRLEPEG